MFQEANFAREQRALAREKKLTPFIPVRLDFYYE